MLKSANRLLTSVLTSSAAASTPGKLAKCLYSAVASTANSNAQHLQEAALEENCILVDENDRSQGLGSKRDCHRVGADGQLKLHRAFSVFLFNSTGDMLIQKRSEHKVSEIYAKTIFNCI